MPSLNMREIMSLVIGRIANAGSISRFDQMIRRGFR
jgi:hypothetical protein